MNPCFSRRSFLQRCSVLGGGVALTGALGRAVEPFRRPGRPRLQLSLAAYSFRQYFKDGARETDPAPASARRIDLFDFIDYCAEQGCAAAEVTSYYFPPAVDDDWLLRLRRHAFLRGVALSGTAVGNRFTLPPGPERDAEIASVKRWIDRAAVLGVPHVRVFAGNRVQPDTLAESKARVRAALEECAGHAGRRGVFLGLENHGGIVAEADDLLDLVRSVRSPWVGINLDTGNFHTADPYADLARCAPYAVNVQVKAEMQPRGRPRGPADLVRLVRLMREANYQGYVALEYESAEDPWTAVPPLLARLRELLA
jgi:sugar phosphate isomerase/epimerase